VIMVAAVVGFRQALDISKNGNDTGGRRKKNGKQAREETVRKKKPFWRGAWDGSRNLGIKLRVGRGLRGGEGLDTNLTKEMPEP